MTTRFSVFLLFTFFLLGCTKRVSTNVQPLGLQHKCLEKLTDVIVYDIYSPPVASRIYAYSNLAYFEGVRMGKQGESSLLTQFKGFDSKPTVNKNEYDYSLVAAAAFLRVARALVFSKDSIAKFEKSIYKQYDFLPSRTISQSLELAEQISQAVIARANNDNYRQTRGMPRFSVYKELGKWEQTPPDYTDAVEPHWRLIRPFLMDSASQFKPDLPPAFSLEQGSKYRQELVEVYEVSKLDRPKNDSIAYYWDDNPFVTDHQGHLMFATKKITPGGHWIGITSILCRQQKLSDVETAKVLALVSGAIFDGFISCWDEKYRSRTVRPITVIRESIESSWNSFLQTPSFPEYTSGHSVISSAASIVLISYFGDKISFTDSTEMEYLGIKRSFSSISAAADEACISRLYGGIHFRSAIEHGKVQGRKIGELFSKLTAAVTYN